MLCGAIPLLPFVFAVPAAPWLATSMTALVFFGIGSGRSRYTTRHWMRCGAETLSIGLLAAGVAYLVGDLLTRLF